jgi:hypothetical protein
MTIHLPINEQSPEQLFASLFNARGKAVAATLKEFDGQLFRISLTTRDVSGVIHYGIQKTSTESTIAVDMISRARVSHCLKGTLKCYLWSNTILGANQPCNHYSGNFSTIIILLSSHNAVSEAREKASV